MNFGISLIIGKAVAFLANTIDKQRGTNISGKITTKLCKDFVAKFEIALKESNETSYWLKLMCETKRIDTTTYQYTEKLCGNIRRLLIASCKTAKENGK